MSAPTPPQEPTPTEPTPDPTPSEPTPTEPTPTEPTPPTAPPAEPPAYQAPPSEATSTDDLLRQILSQQQDHRAEVASLRDEISTQRSRSNPPRPTPTLTEAELIEARQAEIGESEYYCPGCGALYSRPRECTGRGEAPHPPIEVVSTDELQGDDTSKHTAAPGVLP